MFSPQHNLENCEIIESTKGVWIKRTRGWVISTSITHHNECLSKNLQVRPSALFSTTSSETSNNTTISIPLLGGGD